MLKNRVQDLPTQFHLFMVREKRRISEKNIKNKSFISLRAGVDK
jgi:hypothetical protein|tara:strand:+ start:336 stop:467 length:132 start_codon:yes stop_codon:yes gene_type:complete